MVLTTKNIYLEILSERNISSNYVNWMNDYEITKFLEVRWRAQTEQMVLDFVNQMNSSPQNILFGIFLNENKQHIGNIKIGEINWLHRYADIGLLVGERSCWGKGYAAQAIQLVTTYAFNSLNLHKLWAGIYQGNEGSYKAFLKAGWNDAGVLKQHRFFEGKYVNEYLVEIINSSHDNS